MMQKNLLYTALFVVCFSCKSKETAPAEIAPSAPTTPVSVTSIVTEAMEEYIDLNATSSFLQKWIVRANATGYLKSSNIQLNQHVATGQTLYTVKTKEAQSVDNSINVLDSTFRFSGINSIKANGAGFISQINHQNGDYVQDGEQLAIITDTKSFVFLLDIPYELRPYILGKKTLSMVLPDGERLTGTISGNMPTMDVASQTQSIILKVNPPHAIPENLIAKVRIVKTNKLNTASLPKAAVLSNETQSDFWVMKMIDSATAVKVPVKKGIEMTDRIEILSPVFSVSDKILLTGNYGLADTAKVKIEAADPAKE